MNNFIKSSTESISINDQTIFNLPINLNNVTYVNKNKIKYDLTDVFVINFKFKDGDNIEWYYTDETTRDNDLINVKNVDLDSLHASRFVTSQHEDVIINGNIVQKNTGLNINQCKYIRKYTSPLGAMVTDADFGIKFMFLNNYNTIQSYTNENDMLDDQNNLIV